MQAELDKHKVKENFVKEFLVRYSEANKSLSSDFGHLYVGSLGRYLDAADVDELYKEIMISYNRSAEQNTGRRTKLIIDMMREDYVVKGGQIPREIHEMELTAALALIM